MNHSHGQITHTPYGPPENEIPVALGLNLVWRGEGTVMAVPSTLIYTTGTELLVIFRAEEPQPRTA